MKITREQAWAVINIQQQRPDATIAELAREAKSSRNGVRCCKRRYSATGDPECRANPARPQRQSLSVPQVDTLVERCLDNPFESSRELRTQLNLDCSDSTVARRLREHGIGVFRPARKPRLTADHKEVRLQWAYDHAEENWDDVVFSDECSVSSSQGIGTIDFVRRKRGTRYEAQNIRANTRSGRMTVHFWAAFSREGPLDIVRVTGRLNSRGYIDKILKNHVTQYMLAHPEKTFQHDNSPIHTAVKVALYITRKGYRTLSWPPCSPDLSPIENYWASMKREIGLIELPQGNEEVKQAYLWNLVRNKWEQMKVGNGLVLLPAYYQSMPQRIQAVVDAEGGSTKY